MEKILKRIFEITNKWQSWFDSVSIDIHDNSNKERMIVFDFWTKNANDKYYLLFTNYLHENDKEEEIEKQFSKLEDDIVKFLNNK